GFPSAEQLDLDNELDSLRRLPEFQSLQRKVERKHVEALLAVSTPFKFDFPLPDVDGKNVSLADFKGKVTIVDIWGTWCPPCRKEIPHFVDLYKSFKPKGLEIVGINCNEEGTRDEVKKTIKDFASKNKIEYKCVLNDEKTETKIP